MVFCYKNGQSVDSVSIFDRAFQYGDGGFSTARIYQNTIELEHRHRQRLHEMSEKLCLKINFRDLDDTLAQLEQKFDDLNGTLKMMVSRGKGQRGYSFPSQPADLYVFYYPQPCQEHIYTCIESGILQQKMGLNMPRLVGLKTLNRLEQVMLKQEADQHHWLEAVVGDVQDHLVEGVSSNCFIFKNDRWITPELRYNGVHGVMRAEILARMQQQNIGCEQRSVAMHELQEIQALFFCNALNAMKIVTRLDQRPLYSQPCVDLFHTLQLAQI